MHTIRWFLRGEIEILESVKEYNIKWKIFILQLYEISKLHWMNVHIAMFKEHMCCWRECYCYSIV